MPIFADVPDWAVFLVGVLSPPIAWLAVVGLKWVSQRSTKQEAAKKEIVDHQNDLIQSQGDEIDKLRTRADDHEKLIQRLLQHVGYLEGLMTAKGDTNFKPFTMSILNDTAVHKLSPDGAVK